MFWGRYRVSNDTLLPGPAPKTMIVFDDGIFKPHYHKIEILWYYTSMNVYLNCSSSVSTHWRNKSLLFRISQFGNSSNVNTNCCWKLGTTPPPDVITCTIMYPSVMVHTVSWYASSSSSSVFLYRTRGVLVFTTCDDAFFSKMARCYMSQPSRVICFGMGYCVFFCYLIQWMKLYSTEIRIFWPSKSSSL